MDRFVVDERKLRILIVDDEPAVRRTVRRVLGKDHFEFLEAANLDEARASMACRKPPDIVVLDLALQSGDPEEGVELLRELLGQAAYTPVVVLTGRADVKLAVQAMHLGAIDVIEKGDDNELLRNAVQRGLELAIAKRSPAQIESMERLRRAGEVEADETQAEGDERTLGDELAQMFPERRRAMKPMEFYVQEVKKQVLAEAITRAGGNLTDAARALHMKRANFHRLAVRLGLHEPGESRRKSK
ncbi:MAG: response regulator [Polyangiaceae bacterium]